MRIKMTITSLLISASVILAHAPTAAADVDADKQRIMAVCPGVAAWEKSRAHKNTQDSLASRVDNPKLRDRLLKLAATDQSARKKAAAMLAQNSVSALEIFRKVDAANLVSLREIVKANGVPTTAMVGGDGMQAFWTLVQHADADPALQQKVLDALSADSRGLPLGDVAMLADRLQVSAGKPQTYGTQFHRANGQFVPDEIRDVDGLADRRKAMGLMPMDDYRCVLNATYGKQ